LVAGNKDTKQAQILAMLRRNEGASGPRIAEAMGWALHTVRGLLAGLANKHLGRGHLTRPTCQREQARR
jgi:DNA-binding MarR family transcriptional regulator